MNKINPNLKFKSGVYCITNTVNGKRYVGSSNNLYNRLMDHVQCLNSKRAHNAHLQAAWNKYTSDAFEYTILEFCDSEKHFEREQEFISFMLPEYNITANVVANFGHPCNEQTKEKISQTLKQKYSTGEIQTFKNEQAWIPCYLYDIDTYELIQEFPNLNQAGQYIYGYRFSCQNQLCNRVIQDKYCLLTEKLEGLELINTIDKNCKKYIGNRGYSCDRYLIAENISTGELSYFKNSHICAKKLGFSSSMILKHQNATCKNPYISTKAPEYKVYFSLEYIPHAELPKELGISKSGNIGEIPEKENPEINSETKESESSYSVEGETY